MSSLRFKSKISLPKWGRLIKIEFLTQNLENIAAPGYIMSERSGYDSYRYSGGSIHHGG